MIENERLSNEALQLEMKKHYVEAGKIHEQLKNFEKAAYLFAKSNQIEKSAQLLMVAGKLDKAAQLYAKIEDFPRAADLFVKAGNYSAAGRAYVRIGKLETAGQCFEKAGDYREAAKINVVLRNFLKAGELFEKCGDFIRSARAYELMIDQRDIGSLDNKQSRDRIANILMRVQRFEKAAEIYILSQELTEAITMYLRVNDVPAAAKLYANCQGDVGHELLESLSFSDADMVEACIAMFESAKDFKRAGDLCHRRGDHRMAAHYYNLGANFDLAAEMYLEIGDQEKAAIMFGKAGQCLEAGRLYELIGNLQQAALWYETGSHHFHAGKLYNSMERFDKAVEVLQKIGAKEEHFLAASEMISAIFNKKGMIDLAIQRYRKVIAETSLSDQTIEFYYRLARILIEKQEFSEAKVIVDSMLNFASDYKDVSRLQRDVEAAMKKHRQVEKTTDSDQEMAQDWEEAVPELAGIAAKSSPARSVIIGRMEGFEFLKKTSLFEDLNLQEMKLMWDVCETVKYGTGEEIIADDSPGIAFFIIKRGSVTVRKAGEEGEEEILAHLLPGEHFGEMSLIDTSNTSAAIKAEEDVDVFRISREDFNRLIESNERIAQKIYRALLRTLCQRLRISTDKVVYLKSCLDNAGGV